MIYIPVWIDQKRNSYSIKSDYQRNLYSSMDRLETYNYKGIQPELNVFIFQYGQIRNLLKVI